MIHDENALLSTPIKPAELPESPFAVSWDEAVISVKTGDLDRLHKEVWAVVADEDPRARPRDFLYAPMLESDGKVSILVRSERLPSRLPRVRRREMPRSGDAASFRWLLRLNHKDAKTCRHALYEEGEAVEYLTNKLAESGMTLLGDPDMMRGRAEFRRKHVRMEIPFWEAYGRFRMDDPERAVELMLRGAGRMKGFGFGLLMFDLDAGR